MYQKSTAFFMVVQLFNCCTAFQKYRYDDHRICTGLQKMYISVQTPLSMKLRAKESVPEMYSFLFWLYSFLMVVQLFKNIHMRTIEFVQVWKTVHFGTNTIVNEYKSQGQCTKDVQLFSLVVQLFNGCTAFQKYIYKDHIICTALEKTVHFGTHTIVNEIKSQQQCTKDVKLFPLVVQLFNGCTAFQKYT